MHKLMQAKLVILSYKPVQDRLCVGTLGFKFQTFLDPAYFW